ncbi:ABC transporter substrate-binding protein [Patescibacteria group bacterium]|nr:ABC transporter substrate-binding protein [Patescibacteria group bacterium]
MNKNIQIILGIIVLVLIGWYFVGQNNEPEINEPVKIGVMLPLSGDWADFGGNVLSGMSLYADNDPDCEFVVEDSQGKPDGAIKSFNKLVNLDGITNFIGPFGPINMQAVYSSIPEENKDKNKFMAISACSKSFLDFENSLCIYPSPYFQISSSLLTLDEKKDIDNDNFYILFPNDALGEEIEETVDAVFADMNLEIQNKEKINTLDKDYYSVTSKIVQENPDFVSIMTQDNSTNFKIVKELIEKGYEGEVIISSDYDAEQIRKNTDILEGVYFSGVAKNEFGDEFLERFNLKNPDSEVSDALKFYPAIGYAVYEIMCSVSKKDSDYTMNDLIEYTNEKSEYLALKGMKYNEKRQLEFPIRMMVVKNGELVELE